MLMFCPVSGQKHLPHTMEIHIKKLYILHTVFMCEFLCLHRDSEPEERAGYSERSFLQLLPSQTIKLLLSGSATSKSFLPSVSPIV